LIKTGAKAPAFCAFHPCTQNFCALHEKLKYYFNNLLFYLPFLQSPLLKNYRMVHNSKTQNFFVLRIKKSK